MARRSGLGKGLSALIPAEVSGSRDSALREVPIANIHPNPRQPRTHFDDEALASLAASIKEIGVLQPVLVREAPGSAVGEFELIAGERRWRAARRAGLQTIPVLVQTADDTGSLEQALVENLHRQDLNAIEEAAAYQQLIEEFQFSHEQVAKRVGKSRAAVTNTLRLLQLPSGVQKYVVEGQISPGHGRALLGTPDRAFQEELARTIIREGLNVRATEEAVRLHGEPAVGVDEAMGQADRPVTSTQPDSPPTAFVPASVVHPPTPVPAAGSYAQPGGSGGTEPPAGQVLPAAGLLELEELLAGYLNTRVKVEMANKRGRVVIDFATLEDLERIYKLVVAPPGA